MSEGRARAPAPQRAPPPRAQPTCSLAGVGGWAGGQAQPRLPDPPGSPSPAGRGRRQRLPLRERENSALQGSLRAGRSPRPRRSFLCPGPPSAAAAERGCRRGAPRRCPVHQHHLGAVQVAGVAARNGEECCASIPGSLGRGRGRLGQVTSPAPSWVYRVEVTRIPNPIGSPNM